MDKNKQESGWPEWLDQVRAAVNRLVEAWVGIVDGLEDALADVATAAAEIEAGDLEEEEPAGWFRTEEALPADRQRVLWLHPRSPGYWRVGTFRDDKGQYGPYFEGYHAAWFLVDGPTIWAPIPAVPPAAELDRLERGA